MSRIRTCTSASNISSCEFVQRLEKTCKMVVVLNVVACALISLTYQRTRKNAGVEDH